MGMERKHLVVIGNPGAMPEVPGESVQLVAASPPLFEMWQPAEAFGEYLEEMLRVFRECHRVLENGRCICVNVCDTVGREPMYPIPAHYALLLQRAGFRYRDDIIWRRPTPCFPDSALGHIIVMRKGMADFRRISQGEREQAIFDIRTAMRGWGSSSPSLPGSILETLIRLYTCEGETVLDPFLGDGATTRAAAGLNRSSIGYTLDYSALSSLRRVSGIAPDELEIIERRCFE